MFDHRKYINLWDSVITVSNAIGWVMTGGLHLPHSSSASVREDPCTQIAPFTTGAGRNASDRGAADFEDARDARDQMVITLVMSSEDATISHCD